MNIEDTQLELWWNWISSHICVLFIYFLTEAAKIDAQRKEEQLKLKMIIEKERQAARVALEKVCYVCMFSLEGLHVLFIFMFWKAILGLCRWKEQ